MKGPQLRTVKLTKHIWFLHSKA